MADIKGEEIPGETIEVRELWLVQFRQDETYPWTNIGIEREDAAATLRTYDYGLENHADKEHRMVRTNVEVDIVDPEMLRQKIENEKKQRTVQHEAAVLQSE